MSSFFDEASLVMIPSGYKDQKVYSVKPLDGSGDLTFSRASSATRVASNGLIEKVRTNVLLQSNSFDTTWTNTNSTETSGQSGYDGTNNAWLLTATTGGGYIAQSIVDSGIITISVYAKAGTLNWLRITEFNGANAWFDLANGVVGATFSGTNAISRSIESVGGGWYRCSMTTVAGGNSFRLYPATANNSEASAGNIVIQAAQREQGDIATDYIATTTTAVSVGPVSGLPRLDYLNSSCPRLLLEPQRTNLVTFSEQIDNAAWTKDGTTATANQTTSPDGTANADLITAISGLSDRTIYQLHSITVQAYTVSAYVKKNTQRYVHLTLNRQTDAGEWATSNFDLDTATSANYSAAMATPTSTITSVGSGWFRITMTVTPSNAATHILISGLSKAGAPDASRGRYNTDSTNSFYFWGAQLEAGAYATSYIPTLSTSVTRVADAASKTGISSLIGQTEGTLFVELNIAQLGITSGEFFIGNGTDVVGIQFPPAAPNNIRGIVYVGGGFPVIIDVPYSTTGDYKIAFAYKQNNFALYVNGVLGGTDTSGNVPTCSQFVLSPAAIGGIKQALLFKTRLSNSDLAALTA
jgi:hypothetical protein